MPTELTAAPFKHEQQFPYGLEHPRTWTSPLVRPIAPIPAPTHLTLTPPQASHTPPETSHSPPVMQWASFGGVGIPPTGPARLIDCAPNRVLPNGVRNPWAPYDGAAYRPSTDRVENQAISGSFTGTGGMIPAPVAPVAPNSWGGGRAPTVLPSGSVVGGGSSIGWGGGSVVGGQRIDDGWDGASGRAHMGHLPDPTSTAGRLGRSVPTGGGWLQANHARLTPPHLMPEMASRGGEAYLQPPILDAHRPRRLSTSSRPIDGCSACASESGRGLRRARSTGIRKASPGDHIRMGTSPVIGSPLRGGDHAKLVRRDNVGSDGSRGSRASRGSRGRCSECSACA
ncbi:hypothetical protein EHS25_005171 [Saitozyma podzolica]|uniref:Uncharacterized protein n=1 Tax=Saitozyma podzolica TaxID=1890683 RepID=A0A427XYQ2_9TREE|nr:hypothetical protein EHS25_005171 [Saitozyma podzolica]